MSVGAGAGTAAGTAVGDENAARRGLVVDEGEIHEYNNGDDYALHVEEKVDGAGNRAGHEKPKTE
jgi:hypothetical protein